MNPGPPLIGISACRKVLDPHPFHGVGEKYVSAVAIGCGAIPVLLPALGDRMHDPSLLERLDGLVLTGSPSNVEPHRYQARVVDASIEHDAHRDATTLPMIRSAIEAAVPLLAICRGFQELNVALGGTLHQRLETIDGLDEHRENPALPLEARYGPAHAVDLRPGGALARIAGATRIEVNSLHGQGIDRLAPDLDAEATAPDGLIEGVSVARAPAFVVGVQWHPEWRALENPFSRALFGAFGDACRQRAARGRTLERDTAVV